MFLKQKENDLNIRSAYLHLMADAAVSMGIVIGGILMFYLKWFWLDPALSIVIALIILVSTWHLLKESLRLSLDAVPQDISIADIKAIAMQVAGVKDFHHIHIWAMSTAENALTAHLVLASDITIDEEKKIKSELKHQLQHQNIHHITVETERENENCETELC
jgi:cobalt-zinc-cadmium efflux system protein